MSVLDRPPQLRYGAAVVAVIVATVTRLTLDPILGIRFPLTTFFAALIFSAWYGGAGPALLTMALSTLAIPLLILQPRGSLYIAGTEAQAGFVLFLLVGSAITFLGGSMRNAEQRAELGAGQARDRQIQLEREVFDREKAEEQLRVTLTSIGEAVIATDAEGRVGFMNPVAESLTGWKLTEAKGRPLEEIFQIINEYTRQPVENPVHRVLSEGITVGLANHTILLSRAGVEYPIDDSAAPIKDRQGRLLGVVLVFRDVTERRTADDALRISEERFRLAAEAVRGIIYDVDVEAGRVERTRGLFEVLGYQPDEVPTTRAWWFEQIHPEDRDKLINRGERLPSESDYLSSEYRVRHRDGRYLHVVDRCTVVRDESGKVVRLVGCTEDISEVRLAEETLRIADRRKNEFLAVLAHELRNPLAPIRNALHLMGHTAHNGEGFESERSLAERQVTHLARLVDDLMDVSRISRGKIELRKGIVALNSVFDRSIEAIRTLIQERDQSLEVDLPGSTIHLQGDASRLEQIVSNLLSNAAKYTDPGGRIWLSAERDGAAVVIHIRDTGIGIAREMLPSIFEMFVQANHHPQRSQGGLGIGLSLVKTLVEMHEGTITAQSQGEGRGSEFVVRLPALPPFPISNLNFEASRQSMPKTVLPARRVLVVDDNVDAARSLAKVLTRLHGQEVEVAHDGPAALEVALTFRPDIVFLDIGMPDMDGYEVARQLRANPDFAPVLLVALTGWGQETDRRRSEEAGFDLHHVKPVDPRILESLLEKAR